MGKNKINRSLILIFLGYTCVYLDKNIISLSVIPIAQDLGIDAGQKGLILSAFFLGYTLFQIPFGFLGNRLGSRKIMTFAILLMGVLMICLGFGFSFIYLILIRFAAGSFAHAGYPSAVSAFVTKEVEPAKRGSIQSSMIASSGFAGIVGVASCTIANYDWLENDLFCLWHDCAFDWISDASRNSEKQRTAYRCCWSIQYFFF